MGFHVPHRDFCRFDDERATAIGQRRRIEHLKTGGEFQIAIDGPISG